jgi:Sugar-transfer associated ATP-grasp
MADTSKLKLRLRYGYHLSKFILKEMKSKPQLRLSERARLVRQGFFSTSYRLYELDKNQRDQYVTDFRRYVVAPLINREFRFLLSNKIAFHSLLRSFPQYQVELIGTVEDGKLLNEKFVPMSAEDFWDRLQEKGRLVIKPVRGSAGRDVVVIAGDGNAILVGPDRCSLEELVDRIGRLGDSVIEEFVNQHRTLAVFFPKTTNTLRVLTLRDVDTGEPFIAAAVLRIGTERSRPVDNWEKGGLSAPVDLITGELGTAARLDPIGRRLARYEKHPESGAPIAGVFLPFWTEVREGVLEVCRAVPFLRYIGWDIIITEDGFKILEGNNHSGVNSIQTHGPLLVNPAVRRFYNAYT